MVMVSGHDGVVQISICGDIDATLVSQDACVKAPVGEA